MEEIKPKKERKFLKAVGKVAGILLQEFVLGLGRKFIGKKIDRIGNKRQALLIFLALFFNIAFASVDSIPYPITGNKQRLGWQTSGNGLVWRGLSADTITKPTSYADKNVKAYLILDSIRGTIFVWRQTYWDSLLVVGGGGGAFTQPVDSLFFDTSVPTNNVDTAKMRWDSDLGTVVLGMYDQVPNELGFKSFWLVKNQTGSTITKGSIVYANGTVGASGRITVAKFIANGTIEAKYLLGVTAHDLTDGEDGYVISFGKIRQVNTDTFAAGAILYPSPTVAGVWTDIEPIAPNIDMPIGFCINSSSNNGTIAIRVASGYKLSELHDVSITSPVNNASLYYKSSEGLWRDTTAALLLSDTASMLTPYFRDADTTSLNLSSRFASKLNLSDTASMLTNYLRTGVAASTYLTQSNAASTYLPLTGGTLTGTLNGTTGTFTRLNINNTTTEGVLTIKSADFNTASRIEFGDGSVIRKQINYESQYSNLDFRTLAVGGGEGGYSFYTRRNPNAEILSFVIDRDGNSNFYGTLGVTGATNISNTLSATTGTFTGLNVNNTTTEGIFSLQGYDNNTATRIQFKMGNIVRQEIIKPTSASNLQFRSYPTGTAQGGYEFYVSNGSSESLAATIATDKSLSLTGSLGVTGATTLSAPLTVNSSAVFNEGSADADFRVESDGNANMLFVDASTDRVGIGTNSPTKTLEVNGEVKIATTTATPTSLLGKDGSNVVGNVRVITPLTLAGDSINLNTVPISKGGTGSTSESGARSNLGVGYVFYASTAGDAIQLSSNKVFIVNSGGASTTTITLGTATAGRLYMIKNLATGTIISDSSNVIPLNGGSAGTAILSAGNTTTQWCTLVCDGTNWHIMQSN